MKTTLIDALDGITVLHNAGATPELAAISGDDPVSSNEVLNELEQLLESLTMDDETAMELIDLGTDLFVRGENCGFRRGFRVAVRLMMESLDVPEAAT